MLTEKLKHKHLILASGSPRRHQFFKDLGLVFEIRLKPVDEVYPPKLRHFEISDYLAQLKSLPFEDELKPEDILITSDTIVWINEEALGKPKNETDAFEMLKKLSNATHEVRQEGVLIPPTPERIATRNMLVRWHILTKEISSTISEERHNATDEIDTFGYTVSGTLHNVLKAVKKRGGK